MTMIEEGYKKRYKTGETPWDLGRSDFNLIQTVTTMAINPCKALEIGCGTGNNSIWLSKNNFDVIGIDTSEIAIQKALEKASIDNVKCTFIVNDILSNKIEGVPFGFAFDRGCFHSFNSDEERKIFAEKVATHLEKDGLWQVFLETLMKNVIFQVHRSVLPEILGDMPASMVLKLRKIYDVPIDYVKI